MSAEEPGTPVDASRVIAMLTVPGQSERLIGLYPRIDDERMIASVSCAEDEKGDFGQVEVRSF